MPAETHTQRIPLDRGAVSRLVLDQLADLVPGEPDLGEPTRYADLDADSLALMTLVESIEDELGERSVGFHFDDEDLSDLETVGDTVDYVLRRLGSG